MQFRKKNAEWGGAGVVRVFEVEWSGVPGFTPAFILQRRYLFLCLGSKNSQRRRCKKRGFTCAWRLLSCMHGRVRFLDRHYTLAACLDVCILAVRLLVCLSVCLYVCLSVLSVCLGCISACLPGCLSMNVRRTAVTF